MPSKKPPATPKRQPKDSVTHRFQSILTRELCDRLCDTHEAGRDFRNATAVRCQVHPTLLTRWLKLGESDPNAGLATELFMRFGEIESIIRAGYIAEVSDSTASTEETVFDEGKPISKTVVSRRTQGVQWLMERRFRQFRVEHVQKPDETEIVEMLVPQATTYNLETVLAICQQMAAQPERLPAAVRELFASTDWAAPRKMTDGQAEPSH